MGKFFDIITGAAFGFICIVSIISIAIILLNDFILKDSNKKISIRNKIFYIVTCLISVILSSIYTLIEVPKIHENNIAYVGPISTVSKVMANFLFAFVIIMIVCIIILAFFSKKEYEQYEGKIFLISFCVSIITMCFYYWGNKDINSYFSRDNYITQCYVNAYPESSISKNYKLKADIKVDNGSILGFGNKDVYILKIYFENGGYLVPHYQDDSDFKETKKIYIIDQEERHWDIEIPK